MRIICTRKLRIICTPTNFVTYARKNCVLYARQTHGIIWTPKSIFAYQYHELAVLFCVLFIHIFMRPGLIKHDCLQKINSFTCPTKTWASQLRIFSDKSFHIAMLYQCLHCFLSSSVFVFSGFRSFFLLLPYGYWVSLCLHCKTMIISMFHCVFFKAKLLKWL